MPTFEPPVAPAPAAPAYMAPSAPAMAQPVTPAPAMPEPVTPAPAPALAPVAPAFGVAAPYPAHTGFPPVAPLPAAVEPEVLPPRAPELMGADELAAPPRSLPPLYDTAPPLVSPPEGDAPPPFDAPRASAPPQPFDAPQASPPPQPFDALPTPAAPPSTPAPAQAAPPVSAPTPAGRAPLAAPSPLDFSSLLATQVGADDDARPAAGPLAFGSAPDDDDEPDLGRSTTAEKIGLVLAFLVAPIGLIAAIVAAVRSANRRGWVVGIVRASIAIAAVLTVVLAIGGYFGYLQFKQQQTHDQTAAASAAFCATIKANPTMDQLPTFGWPAVGASIPESLKAMQAYQDRWAKLAKVSPAGIKPGVTSVATAAKKIIDSVTVARTVDDASNVTVMSAVAGTSGVPAWHSQYCG